MFQYAFGRSVSLSRNEPLYFDKSLVDADAQRSYSLGAYGLSLDFNGPNGPVFMEKNFEKGSIYDPRVLSAPRGVVFFGYWQTWKYFNNEVIRKEFARPVGEPSTDTAAIADQIRSAKSSAFVSVRRGDYVKLKWDLPADYYTRCMDTIENKHPGTEFFIFSDDRDWCKSAFAHCTNSTVVSTSQLDTSTHCGTVHWDLWLMSQCQHAVLSNSTFSWWGAWLGTREDRTIIAPKAWIPNVDSRDLFPEGWIKL